MSYLYYAIHFSFLSIFICHILACDSKGVFNNNEDNKTVLPISDNSAIDQVPATELKPALNPAVPALIDESGFSSGGGGGANPGTSYKGGSRGKTRPAATGNPDVGIIVQGPNGECGNGVQEVLAQNEAACPFRIYGTALAETGSTLNAIDPSTGIASFVAPITGLIQGKVVIDFAPDGTLYGVAERIGIGGSRVLVTIDCRTGHASIIGDTGIVLPSDVSDISFDSQGRLWAYVKTINDTDTVGTISLFDGSYSSVGLTGLDDEANALGSAPFIFDELYHAGALSLSTLSKLTGLASAVSLLNFPARLDDPIINAMDADFFNDTMYVAMNDGSNNYIGAINLGTAAVYFLTTPPKLAPAGFSGLAVNRIFEVCDIESAEPPAPVGSVCSDDCDEFVELFCNDGIDNDFDGLTDCSDENCAGLSCSDGEGCTTGDTCNAGECAGTVVNCEAIVANQCTIDICSELDDNSFVCNSVFDEAKADFGDCAVDGDLCSLGRCIAANPASNSFCFEQPKALIPTEDGGCADDDSCTADACNPEDGACIFESLVGVSCQADNNLCSFGSCVMSGNGTPLDPFEVECVENNTVACGNTDNNVCTSEACNALTGLCDSTPVANGTACNDNNICTAGVTTCLNGVCQGGTVLDCAETPTDNPCTLDFCDNDIPGGCEHLALNGPSGPACIAIDPTTGEQYLGACAEAYTVCDDGVASGTCQPVLHPGDVPEICADTLDNDCDGLADNEDPDCFLAVFISSATFTPDFGGFAVTDAACNSLAAAASLPGTFVSFVSDGNSNAASRLGSVTRPWYLVNNTTKIADNSADLLDGSIDNPISLNENGVGISPIVWTGTNVSGISTGSHCLNWSAISISNSGTLGAANFTDSRWTDAGAIGCTSMSRSVYCFEVPAP